MHNLCIYKHFIIRLLPSLLQALCAAGRSEEAVDILLVSPCLNSAVCCTAILYCAVLYCTVLCCTVLYCAVLCCSAVLLVHQWLSASNHLLSSIPCTIS
jgi:hypothetical protein